MGRATQGVRVMNLKDDDRVSAVALVVEDSSPVVADAVEELPEGAIDESDVIEATGPTGESLDGPLTRKPRRTPLPTRPLSRMTRPEPLGTSTHGPG